MQAIVKELVDHGQPYLERSGEIIKSTKIDFEYIQAISRKKITVGALIAHAISVNNFEQILSTLNNILGNGFRGNWKPFTIVTQSKFMARRKPQLFLIFPQWRAT